MSRRYPVLSAWRRWQVERNRRLILRFLRAVAKAKREGVR